jgi:hypothetical protein
MNASYYLAGIPVTLLGLWFLWNYGWQGYLISRFRDRLFEIRSELFLLCVEGNLEFNGIVNSGLRFRLNALLRFARGVSFLSLVIAAVTERRTDESDPYIERWERAADQLPEPTKLKVRELERYMLASFASHIVWSSMVLAPLALIVKLSGAIAGAVKHAKAGVVSGAAIWMKTDKVLKITGLENGARGLEAEVYREERECLRLHRHPTPA